MIRKILLALLILAITGCSQSLLMQGRHLADEGQYDQAIDLLYEGIKINPQSAEAWRELGVVFYKKNDMIKAEEALSQANSIKPMARTNLYLGLIHEGREDFPNAIESYRAAMGLNPSSSIEKKIRFRLDGLIQKNIKREVSAAINNEAAIKADEIPNNTIAVVDFDNTYLSEEMAPISKGLAELTAVDLAKIGSLKVVDRLKIDAIMNEIKMAESGYVDPSMAPRVGRLVGSNRIVTGSLVGLGDEVIRMDGVVVNTRDSSSLVTNPTEGNIQKIFEVQKDFVFKVINNIGINLTAEERDAIEKIPTESYLAFMAYCRGLDYRSQGLNQEAQREFRNALKNDPGFNQARDQNNAAARAISADATKSASFNQFEADVTTSSDQEQAGEGTDNLQDLNLTKNGFMRDDGHFGSKTDSPLRIDDRERYGTVIIRGILDASW
ncbi:MAG: tetratricopeptide repeat protein [Candidatus Zixiibacteriota bacterium]